MYSLLIKKKKHDHCSYNVGVQLLNLFIFIKYKIIKKKKKVLEKCL